jgi:hypothetical protein
MGANAGHDQQHDISQSHSQRDLEDLCRATRAVNVDVHISSVRGLEMGFKPSNRDASLHGKKESVKSIWMFKLRPARPITLCAPRSEGYDPSSPLTLSERRHGCNGKGRSLEHGRNH